MQVQAINNNQPSFGAIYQPKNINFNKVQEPIVEAIKKAMREPLQKFKGETAEGFYKSKGLDFEIKPRSDESVRLYAYKGLKETGVGVNRGQTYSDSIYIGEYDKNSEFRVSDIESGIKDNNKNNIFVLFLLAEVAIGTVIAGWNLFTKMSQETTKPLIENVDSVANKAKAVLPDTTAVKTKVLKVIKK